jgi:hypothetical protein
VKKTATKRATATRAAARKLPPPKAAT